MTGRENNQPFSSSGEMYQVGDDHPGHHHFHEKKAGPEKGVRPAQLLMSGGRAQFKNDLYCLFRSKFPRVPPQSFHLIRDQSFHYTGAQATLFYTYSKKSAFVLKNGFHSYTTRGDLCFT
jgi:hypothetical protein